MLSLYRAWLPPLCLAYPPPAALPRPAPPPGAHRPIPRLASLASVAPAAAAAAAASASPASPASSDSTELDVVELPESPEQRRRIQPLALSIAAAASTASGSLALAAQHHQQATATATATASGAVLDIACCDGPVRFTRVLNESWCGAVEATTSAAAPAAAAEGGCGRCSSRAGYNYKPSGCHRKHAAAARHAAADTVQYYPCKTCGSKFPSYYFVHKHRKQCHPEDEPHAPAASATAQTQRQAVDIVV